MTPVLINIIITYEITPTNLKVLNSIMAEFVFVLVCNGTRVSRTRDFSSLSKYV